MRKKILTLISAAALILATIICFLAVQKISKSTVKQPLPKISIYVASDLHYIAPELTDNGTYFMNMVRNADGKAMQYSEEITDSFVEQVLQKKPNLVLLSGDLTFNGAKASHEALAKKLRKIESAGIPVLVIPGNHDLYNPMSASFQGDSYAFVPSTSAEELESLYGSFRYDKVLSRDPDSLSYSYEVSPGLRILLVDVNTKENPGILTDRTYEWVEKQLKDAQAAGASVIAVSHQNVLAHNRLFTEGFVMKNNEKLSALYEKYRVLCNLSGHMHLQHIAQSENGLVEIATSALPVSPCQYGVLKVTPEDGVRYHTEQLNFPHAEEAEQLMWDSSIRTVKEEVDDPSETLCSFFAELNTAYFAGRTDRVAWNETLYRQLCTEPSFLGIYMQSIYEDGLKNQNEVHIALKK